MDARILDTGRALITGKSGDIVKQFILDVNCDEGGQIKPATPAAWKEWSQDVRAVDVRDVSYHAIKEMAEELWWGRNMICHFNIFAVCEPSDGVVRGIATELEGLMKNHPGLGDKILAGLRETRANGGNASSLTAGWCEILVEALKSEFPLVAAFVKRCRDEKLV